MYIWELRFTCKDECERDHLSQSIIINTKAKATGSFGGINVTFIFVAMVQVIKIRERHDM